MFTAEECLLLDYVVEAQERRFITVDEDRITYELREPRDYVWTDPEEWVRCACIAWLTIKAGYPPHRMGTEVVVPRREPSDSADVVVYRDDECKSPYLVVENKAAATSERQRLQGIEQGFGNANSLRAEYVLYDQYDESLAFDNTSKFPSMERDLNRLGPRDRLPQGYSTNQLVYRLVAGDPQSDIQAVDSIDLGNRVRRAHSTIWAGGLRDPLTAFDEWSKVLFAKVHDERTTVNGEPRQFQIALGESETVVASRIHTLFRQARQSDVSIFPAGIRIDLPDSVLVKMVEILQDASFVTSDIDAIGRAFESFFSTIFRGQLGQYFTMRQLARFIVAVVDVEPDNFVIDPTAGSGGFLLESLRYVNRKIEDRHAGQPELERRKYDFAMSNIHGIEIHSTLARILKINLLLHHDGHTNVEGARSCLVVRR